MYLIFTSPIIFHVIGFIMVYFINVTNSIIDLHFWRAYLYIYIYHPYLVISGRFIIWFTTCLIILYLYIYKL